MLCPTHCERGGAGGVNKRTSFLLTRIGEIMYKFFARPCDCGDLHKIRKNILAARQVYGTSSWQKNTCEIVQRNPKNKADYAAGFIPPSESIKAIPPNVSVASDRWRAISRLTAIGSSMAWESKPLKTNDILKEVKLNTVWPRVDCMNNAKNTSGGSVFRLQSSAWTNHPKRNAKCSLQLILETR